MSFRCGGLRCTLLVAVAALFSAACSSSPEPPDRVGSVAGAPSVISGPVTKVDSRGLGDVRSFQIKDGATVYQIFIDRHADYGPFSPDHLAEHLASAQPVRVEVRADGDRLVAVSIEDA